MYRSSGQSETKYESWEKQRLKNIKTYLKIQSLLVHRLVQTSRTRDTRVLRSSSRPTGNRRTVRRVRTLSIFVC